MKKQVLRNAVLLYVAGLLLCASSVGLMLYWRQGGITVPGMVRNVVGGLPWIGVAVAIVIWRAKELPKIYPLAYVFGTGTPFLLMVMRGLLW